MPALQAAPGRRPNTWYDNWEVLATECRPPLTTVDLNLEQLGTTAVKHLFARLDGNQHAGVIRRPGRLVGRAHPPALRPARSDHHQRQAGTPPVAW